MLMVGFDGYCGWFYLFGVVNDVCWFGVGCVLIVYVESVFVVCGCLKINLQVLFGNDDVCCFYVVFGYCVEECILFGKMLLVV